MSLRVHEIDLILKWIGVREGVVVTERMILDAIKYAYDMGYTDGSDDGAEHVIMKERG